MRTIILLSLIFLFSSTSLVSQTTRQAGLRENTPAVFAFTNAHIITHPGHSMEGATMVVRDGVIERIGRRVSIPDDAFIIDLEGKTVYPGFIDISSSYGLSDPPKEEMLSQTHWSPQVRSFYHAADAFRTNEKEASALRSQGFVLAHTMPSHGIFGGQGALVKLGEGEASAIILGKGVSQAMSLRRSALLDRDYPHSTMGALSMIRQTFYDADWYWHAHNTYSSRQQGLTRPETNVALSILAEDLRAGKPFLLDIPDEQWIRRAEDLAGEFGIKLWILASGYEYRRAEDLSGLSTPLIVSLNFPKAPEAGSPEESLQLSLEDLRHWHLAPENPSAVASKRITFALTSRGLNSTGMFLTNLRKAISRGLSEDEALAALTITPARMLGLESSYGTLEQGKSASFVVASGNLFQEGQEVEQVWIDGRQYQVKSDRPDPRGEWIIQSPASMKDLSLHFEGEINRLRGHAKKGDVTERLQAVKIDQQRLLFRLSGDSLGLTHSHRMSANLAEEEMLGIAGLANGEIISWRASRSAATDRTPGKSADTEKKPLDLPARFPSLDYGLTSLPEQPRHVLISNATIWTQGPEGIMEQSDMLITSGKIAAVGQGINPPGGALVIDASGMHVTPGLVDPHLHTSIAGNVNETASAITAETRILDVIDANNVWLYRLLAGGLTTAKLFHGSANPIGGQDAVIKMRWGMHADGLVMKEAKPGLKFALGENVKRSAERYPNTRMGVEQIIKDAFEAALQYEHDWQRWERSRQGLPPRRDLQLEPILEVLRGERLSHVHAYRQDEMLMMMRLAEEYGFSITSFEHTLEGYKVADELRAHGAAAVVWTDWSSFKVEASDGILQNARLLLDAGVLTSLHSDNTQLATRMNWEAAKAIKTGIPEEEAMNLITLYPAKILQIDHLVGSLEVGKDADFVIWNGHPMSSFTTADQTWIEGRKYFDKAEDRLLQEEMRQERASIIQHIIENQSRENN